MLPSFIAYIDESGDEGFTFNDDGSGSSRWLVLSAVVMRRSNDLAVVTTLKTARQRLEMDAKKPFHFSGMRHEPRLVLMSELAKLPFRTVSVISYKPDIPDPENYQANKCLLYRYLTRLLIERVSWLCRDCRKAEGEDDRVELIFSDRASMSYDAIKGYITLLKQQGEAGQFVSIHWPSIDLDHLRAVQHAHLAGLQVADAVATGYMYGIRLSRFGIADPSYVRHLSKHVYRHRGNYLGYGVKFLSRIESLKERMPHLNATFKDW